MINTELGYLLPHADQEEFGKITPEGRAKLIDLGLARLKRTDPAGADLTASGVTLGTFDYISPEQARDPRSADIRSR